MQNTGALTDRTAHSPTTDTGSRVGGKVRKILSFNVAWTGVKVVGLGLLPSLRFEHRSRPNNDVEWKDVQFCIGYYLTFNYCIVKCFCSVGVI